MSYLSAIQAGTDSPHPGAATRLESELAARRCGAKKEFLKQFLSNSSIPSLLAFERCERDESLLPLFPSRDWSFARRPIPVPVARLQPSPDSNRLLAPSPAGFQTCPTRPTAPAAGPRSSPNSLAPSCR